MSVRIFSTSSIGSKIMCVVPSCQRRRWRGKNRGPDGNFSAAKWALRASGLQGPVTLTPLLALNPK
jgi:hypothetical protein